MRIVCRLLPIHMVLYLFKRIRDYKMTPGYFYTAVVLSLLLVIDPFEELTVKSIFLEKCK